MPPGPQEAPRPAGNIVPPLAENVARGAGGLAVGAEHQAPGGAADDIDRPGAALESDPGAVDDLIERVGGPPESKNNDSTEPAVWSAWNSTTDGPLSGVGDKAA